MSGKTVVACKWLAMETDMNTDHANRTWKNYALWSLIRCMSWFEEPTCSCHKQSSVCTFCKVGRSHCPVQDILFPTAVVESGRAQFVFAGRNSSMMIDVDGCSVSTILFVSNFGSMIPNGFQIFPDLPSEHVYTFCARFSSFSFFRDCSSHRNLEGPSNSQCHPVAVILTYWRGQIVVSRAQQLR